jgi:hypothetical protein
MATKQSVRGGWSGIAMGVKKSQVPLVIFITSNVMYDCFPPGTTLKHEKRTTYDENILNVIICANNYN